MPAAVVPIVLSYIKWRHEENSWNSFSESSMCICYGMYDIIDSEGWLDQKETLDKYNPYEIQNPIIDINCISALKFRAKVTSDTG